VVGFFSYGFFNLSDNPGNSDGVYPSQVINPGGSDTTPPAGFFQTQFNFNYSTATNGMPAGTVGALYLNGKYYFNRWNGTYTYRYNANGPNGGPGTFKDSLSYIGSVRDMTTDGRYIYGGPATSTLYKFDTNMAVVNTFTVSGASFRAIAYDPNRKAFWNSAFAGNITCQDTAGVLKGTITNNLTAKYGMGWDSVPGQPAVLYVWSQDAVTPNDSNILVKYNIQTGAEVQRWVISLAGGLGIAGGANVVTGAVPGSVTLLLNYQNYALVGYKLRDIPVQAGLTLVMLNDTIYGSATQIALKKADNDTVMRAVQANLNPANYNVMLRDTAANSFTTLRNYQNLIFVETSFITPSRLKQGQRDSIRAFLNSGSPTNKKRIVIFGGDFGYNYGGGAGGIYTDTTLMTALNIKYLTDNGNIAANSRIVGVNVNTGTKDSLLTSFSNFYPDALRPVNSGQVLYGFDGRTTSDSAVSVGYIGANYNNATLTADPRYIRSTTSDPAGGFNRVFRGLLLYVGGIITGTVNNTAQIPNAYQLSQNFPNPFNPVTKINYSLPKSGFVTLKIFDVLGRQVATLINENKNSGSYSVEFNGAKLSSGIYFYKLQVNDFTEVKRMMLVK
jgi:hypothetical protein